MKIMEHERYDRWERLVATYTDAKLDAMSMADIERTFCLERQGLAYHIRDHRKPRREAILTLIQKKKENAFHGYQRD